MAKTALFTNFTSKKFTGYWDGKAKPFQPGDFLYMPDYLARHYAKHLTNRELLSTDKDGNLIYKNGDKMTSPKRQSDVPMFMELFNKAYTPDTTEADEEKTNKEDVDSIIDSENKNRKNDVEENKTEDKKSEEGEFENQPNEPSNLLKT